MPSYYMPQVQGQMEIKLDHGTETVRRAAPMSGGCTIEGHLRDKQESEHEELQREHVLLLEESVLQIQTQKHLEESGYVNEPASAATIALKTLASEVTKLSPHHAKLEKELQVARDLGQSGGSSKPLTSSDRREIMMA
ncbi:hypothetical protein Nepgr_022223 [Nepenthes gracilis]|uniref:Uncharacterized protein n=1 Tax=Nepenthes gracilis TaxID=150966 RepID=A0AAD3XWL6_NEPGR|nr:hypothetical protein Nepgr_022223 [Nepenthes gracilis]